MSKAEELAEIKYPIHSVLFVPARGGGYYADKHLRDGFIAGYHQAEKDLSDQAREAVKVARTEIYKWLDENAHKYSNLGLSTDAMLKDLKQAVKDE